MKLPEELPTGTNLPSSDWEILIQACKDRNLDPSIVTRPEMHKGQAECTGRASVLRAMRRQGVRLEALQSICPLNMRTIRGIVNEPLNELTLTGKPQSIEA